MSAASPLAWLLDPLPVPAFYDDVYATRPHHVHRGDPDYFASLPSGPGAVDQLLGALVPDPSGVHAVRGPEHRDTAAYRLPDGTLNVEAVRADYAAGYTIVLDNLERYVRPLTEFANALERELNFATQVNAYLTPPHSTGFLPHYDHHDVFVLQVHGAKRWHFYGDSTVAPRQMHRRMEVAEVFPGGLPAPVELTLSVGDTMYLPRGRVHAARTLDEPSVHLTVGIHVPTVLDLLGQALNTLSHVDDRIHARLPAGHLTDPAARAAAGAIFTETLTLIGQAEAIDGGLEAFEDLLVRRGLAPPVGSVRDALGIDDATIVVKHQPLYSRVAKADGRVGLQFAKLLIGADLDHEPAMRFLSESCEPFPVGQLPGLTARQRVELARQLLTSGFLRRLPPD